MATQCYEYNFKDNYVPIENMVSVKSEKLVTTLFPLCVPKHYLKMMCIT